MKLSYDEKTKILDSFAPGLTKRSIKYGKTNYYFDESKYRRKVVARELTKSGNGYIYVGYLKEYKDKADDRGFINIDKFINSENEFIILMQKVIASFR